MEFCAPKGGCADEGCLHQLEAEGCALDDEENWRRSNPALGRRITLDYIRKERRALPPEEFARERLGWWDEAGTTDAAFGAGRWEACAGLKPKGLKIAAYGLAATLDMTHCAVVAAALDGTVVHVRPLQHGPGSNWVLDRLKGLPAAPVVVDSYGPAGSLIPDLEAAGLEVIQANTKDVLDGCAKTLNMVRERQLRHANYPELDSAVRGAVRREVRDRWAWGRKQSTSDVSTLEAATLAAWHTSLPLEEIVPPATPMALDSGSSGADDMFDSIGF
jgi:phage terminase large subunit-like protein